MTDYDVLEDLVRDVEDEGLRKLLQALAYYTVKEHNEEWLKANPYTVGVYESGSADDILDTVKSRVLDFIRTGAHEEGLVLFKAWVLLRDLLHENRSHSVYGEPYEVWITALANTNIGQIVVKSIKSGLSLCRFYKTDLPQWMRVEVDNISGRQQKPKEREG